MRTEVTHFLPGDLSQALRPLASALMAKGTDCFVKGDETDQTRPDATHGRQPAPRLRVARTADCLGWDPGSSPYCLYRRPLCLLAPAPGADMKSKSVNLSNAAVNCAWHGADIYRGLIITGVVTVAHYYDRTGQAGAQRGRQDTWH